MTDPRTAKMLEVLTETCVRHGLDRAAFLDLMRAGFGSAVAAGEPALSDVARFLIASGDWMAPPRTPDMERRRAEARRSWAEWTQGRRR